MRFSEERERNLPKRGTDMPCPTCGKKFVGFDVGTGIVYLCPRCRTPEQFEQLINDVNEGDAEGDA